MESPEDPGADPAPSPVLFDIRTSRELHEQALYRFYSEMASQLSPVHVVGNFLHRIRIFPTDKAFEKFTPASLYRRCLSTPWSHAFCCSHIGTNRVSETPQGIASLGTFEV